MSSRPVSPPPLARWPFFAGAVVLIAVAFYLLITAGRPPAVPPLIAGMFCLGGSIVLCAIPFILENERRLRLAEAAVRDAADAQLRRLAQTADQLTHVVSRGQSTEEQAGRALGTLEEVAERMVNQAEELVAALGRAGEREQAAQNEEVQRLIDERDQKLSSLEIRLNAASLALSETQVAIRKAAVSQTRAIEALAARLDAVAGELRSAWATQPTASSASAPAEPPLIPHEHGIVDTAPKPFETEHPTTEVKREEPVESVPQRPSAAVAEAVAPGSAEDGPSSSAPALTSETVTAESLEDAPPPSPRPRKVRAARIAEKIADEPHASTEPAPGDAEPPSAAPKAALELALEGMPEPRPVMRLNRREPPGSTSVVATAYIGIGNKLYLRGDGPGLSWERGVPMQFLAIGKWGWTTTDATVPVTCRVYRNDDTPMLEENIVIDPGTKAEITPKF